MEEATGCPSNIIQISQEILKSLRKILDKGKFTIICEDTDSFTMNT